MKRLGIFLLVFGLLASINSSPALGQRSKRRVERTDVQQYRAPAPGLHTPVPYALVEYPCAAGLPEGCVRFTSERGERYVSLEIADAVSDNIFFWVDRGDGNYVDFCGLSTPKPIRISGAEITVFLFEGTCTSNDGYAPSVVTNGTVTGTFSNTP